MLYIKMHNPLLEGNILCNCVGQAIIIRPCDRITILRGRETPEQPHNNNKYNSISLAQTLHLVFYHVLRRRAGVSFLPTNWTISSALSSQHDWIASFINKCCVCIFIIPRMHISTTDSTPMAEVNCKCTRSDTFTGSHRQQLRYRVLYTHYVIIHAICPKQISMWWRTPCSKAKCA